MKNIKHVKMDLESCFQLLNDIALKEGITDIIYDYKPQKDPYQFRFNNGGLLNIYTSGKGLTISSNYGNKQELGAEILEKFHEMLDNEDQIVKSSYARYTLNENKDKQIFTSELKDAIEEIGGSIREKGNAECEYFQWEAIKDREKITIILYNNGTLLVQGKTHLFWDNVCEWIEKKIESPVTEILIRVTSDKNINKKLKSLSDEEVVNSSERRLEHRLGDSYKFLYDHDKKFLVASLSLLRYNDILPDYSSIIMPSFKALEGYTKKILVSNYPSLEDEIYKPSFRFSRVFDYNELLDTHKLKNHYFINTAKASALERLYVKLRDDRNPYMHSTGPITSTCDNIDEAESIVSEVLSLISGTYTRLR